MSNIAIYPVIKATWETIYMVSISGFLGVFFGLWLGILLFLTRKKQLLGSSWIYPLCSFLVNVGRSIPFIILLIILTPITEHLVGATIGSGAAIVPLVVAAIPFFARIAESAYAAVPEGILEASQAHGATRWQLITRYIFPKSWCLLIKGATLTWVSLVGYSAMAGAVGGGGLGQLAISYGYERFNGVVLTETVIILVLLVQILQWLGDCLSKTHRYRLGLASVVAGVLSVCFVHAIHFKPHPPHVLRVGVMSGVSEALLSGVKKIASDQYGLDIEVVAFSDYVQPNVALNNGSIDANIFQHVPYLNAQIKSHGHNISPIAKTFVYQFGFYSQEINNISELKYGSTIAIPNDPSNEGRALLLLRNAGLIALKSGVGLFPTPEDVIKNPKDLKFVTLNAAQIPRALNHVALGGLTNDYTKALGLVPSQAVILEGPDSPYANVIVVRNRDKKSPAIQKLVAVIHSKAYTDAVLKAFPNGSAIPAFETKAR